MESKRWTRLNSLTLSRAIQAFRLDKCKVVLAAVWYGGWKRTGSGTRVAACDHTHAYSLFRFKPGSLFAFGKILFIFEVQLSPIAAEVTGVVCHRH